MSNQRTLDRHALNVYLKVLDAETGEPVGRLVDLTIAGMRVVCNQPVEQGREYQLLISTDIGPDERQTVRLDARCTWCGPDVNPELQSAGFAFESLRPGHETMLARVIRQFKFDNTC